MKTKSLMNLIKISLKVWNKEIFSFTIRIF